MPVLAVEDGWARKMPATGIWKMRELASSRAEVATEEGRTSAPTRRLKKRRGSR